MERDACVAWLERREAELEAEEAVLPTVGRWRRRWIRTRAELESVREALADARSMLVLEAMLCAWDGPALVLLRGGRR